IAAWIASAFRHPVKFARAMWPFGFARQTLILLVMQTIDSTLKFALRRRRWHPDHVERRDPVRPADDRALHRRLRDGRRRRARRDRRAASRVRLSEPVRRRR